MKDERNRKPDFRNYRQQNQLNPFQGKFERRQIPDRRIKNNPDSAWFVRSARRRAPDRRISNIEVDWLAEDSVISM